jgi:hypothetical protein
MTRTRMGPVRADFGDPAESDARDRTACPIALNILAFSTLIQLENVFRSLRLDGELARPTQVLHRIDAVSDQVHHDLLQLHAISHDRGKICRRSDGYGISRYPRAPLPRGAFFRSSVCSGPVFVAGPLAHGDRTGGWGIKDRLSQGAPGRAVTFGGGGAFREQMSLPKGA